MWRAPTYGEDIRMEVRSMTKLTWFPRSRWSAAVLILLGSLIVALASSAGAPLARAQTSTTVLVGQNPTLGAILTDPNGMTLYIRTTDTPGVSTCSGMCAVAWPPFQPPSATLALPAGVGGSLSMITRDDGTQQVAYNGMPLYYWAKDMQPGDATGQGIGGFVVAQPQAAPATTGPTVLLSKDPTLGAILTDAKGMTLYIRTTDMPNTSTCSGQCAAVWPALQPSSASLTASAAVTGTLAVITRADGTQQVTYNGMPLYYFAKDVNPGDVNGQGVGGFVAATP
jgi:predicted lipoprotein with Yx(FWY)xxD motif